MYKITLEAARVNAGLNRREAAKAMDVCPETLSKWEKGKAGIKAADFVKLCELYNVPQGAVILP